MGYVPGFANDVFISYSHRDNQGVDDEGWVTEFHRRLQIELDEALGAEAAVWRDRRIDSATNFSADLSKQLRDTAVLVAVVSPSYFNSPWCKWELNGFVAATRQAGELWVDNKSRAIKVIKRPLEDNAHRELPPREATGFDLFRFDRERVRSYELESDSPEFRRRLDDLAQDICGVLKRFRRQKTVYLGTAPPGMAPQREKVRKELEAQQYQVVSALEGDSQEAASVVQKMLGASVSIRFVDRAGEHPAALADTERTMGTEAKVRQVVVVHDPDIQNRSSWDLSPEQTSDDVEVLVNATTTGVNETVLQKLQRPAAQDDKELTEIYLICEREDHPFLAENAARNLLDYLAIRGFEVKVPLAEGDDGQFSKDNRSKLTSCDGVLLYWGGSQQGWFEERLRELRKARGWRKDKAFAAKGAYVAGPPTPVKEHFETKEVQELIKQFKTLDLADERLLRFIARLEQRDNAG